MNATERNVQALMEAVRLLQEGREDMLAQMRHIENGLATQAQLILQLQHLFATRTVSRDSGPT